MTEETDVLTLLKTRDTLRPRACRMRIDTTAISARISAYSTSA